MLQHHDRLYAGIDLHKSYSYITVMDQLGYIQYQGKHKHKEKTLIPKLKSFSKPLIVSMESTYGWYSQADELEEAGIKYILAHPAKINAIAGKKKTDKGDSRIMADLHRTRLLPQSYAPPKAIRELKQLVRFRIQLVRQQTRVRTLIRDILQKQRLDCPYTDVLGKKSLIWLKAQLHRPVYKRQIQTLLNQAATNQQELDSYNQLIKAWSKKDKTATLLQSIPGIGSIVAVVLAVEIGSLDRFANGRSFASYCGVTPSVKSSGGKTYLGKTNKHANPYLRWSLAEAVNHLIRKDPTVKEKYDRLVVAKGKSKAKVAMMNKLARIIYAVIKREAPYYKEALPPSD